MFMSPCRQVFNILMLEIYNELIVELTGVDLGLLAVYLSLC